MKLVYQYVVIFFIFKPIQVIFNPLQVENCGRNSRHVVDEDDNGKFRLERVKVHRRRQSIVKTVDSDLRI